MSYGAKPTQEYVKNAVMTATPEQLQLMLYDGAIRFTLRGAEAIRAGDREAAFNNFDRAQQIVLELRNGLRREVNPELADQMSALYGFIHSRLVEANMQQSEAAVEDALRILRHQRETWVLLIEKIRKEVPGHGVVQKNVARPEAPPAAAPAPRAQRTRFQPDAAEDSSATSFVAEG